MEFGKNVIVDTSSGVPRLALLIGDSTQYATYNLGSGSSTLTFTYTVGQLDMDEDGVSITSPIDNQVAPLKVPLRRMLFLHLHRLKIFQESLSIFQELNLGTAGLDCSNTAPKPAGYSNSRNHTQIYKVRDTFFYRMDLSGLTAQVDEFEFCLSPDLKITTDLIQSYVTESSSLVWEGQVKDTPASLAHQVANSIILVKRNNELMGTIWANGHLYRIWTFTNGLYRVEHIDSASGSEEECFR